MQADNDWQLVPVRPTPEMLEQFKRPPFAGLTLGDRYARMLASAPQPSQHQPRNTDMATVNTCVHDTMVPGDADDMAEALAEISEALNCANTKDDILHAIDALRNTNG